MADEPLAEDGPLLQLRGIIKEYANGTRALQGIDLDFRAGETVAIIGRSGSGKSTLLNILGLLDTPSKGHLAIEGKSLDTASDKARSAWRAADLGFVFQRSHLIPNLSVEENVRLGTRYSAHDQNLTSQSVAQALEEVGLADRKTAIAKTLSGGEMQRVAIARTLARPARLWLADEPTGNLDSSQSEEIINLLKQRAKEHGATLIVVTHEPEIAQRLDRIITLSDGRVVADTHNTEVGPLPKMDAERRRKPSRLKTRVTGLRRLARTWTFIMQGIASSPGRTRSGVVSTALAVALTVVALGLAESASAQVTGLFDAQRATQVTADIVYEDAERVRWPLKVDAVTDFPGVEGFEFWQEHTDVQMANGTFATTAGSVIEVKDVPGMITESKIEWAASTQPKLDSGEVILGHLLAKRLEITQPDLMPEVSIGDQNLRVVGVLMHSRSGIAPGQAFVNTETGETLGATQSNTLYVKTVSGGAQNLAHNLRALIDPYEQAMVSVEPVLQPDSYRGELQDSVAASLIVLAAVASLAGLGAVILVNVLSVNSRIAEFGVRRAFGARRRELVNLVVGECTLLGLMGSIVGLALGFIAIMIITTIARWQPIFNPTLLLIPLAGAVLFGTLGSIPPAVTASRIEPADAVRS